MDRPPRLRRGEEGADGQARVVANEPGLYFVGLVFLSAVSSALILGVARDAEYVVKNISSPTTWGQTRGWIEHV
jgi:hypothetical protein